MKPDFISLYYPELSEIPSADVLDARFRLETHLRAQYPDLDTRVNSVFGDLILTPFAHMLAAFETSMERFMSDLDLANVANGVVYNCEFVKDYLRNFAIVDHDNLVSSGVIRLTFCVDDDYTIDRRTQYQFGSGNDFTLRLPYAGHLEIKSSGSALSSDQNTRALVQVDDSKWACDVGVIGSMSGNPVLKGDAGTTDVSVTDLESIVASLDFVAGLPEDSLSELAERARKTFYSATMATRNGARHFLMKEFPELVAISPVISGDEEQLRGTASILGAPDGRADIYVKSSGYAGVDSQILTLEFDTSDSRYKGQLTLLNPPCEIVSISSVESPDTDLGFGNGGVTILSRSTDFGKAPYLTSAYSSYEELFIAIDEPTPELSNEVISGDQFHSFLLTYRADPVVPVVSDVVDSPDNAPIGVDVLTRGFVVIRITSLTISYVKKSGVKMALNTAREEIHKYFKNLGYDSVYSDSRIVDTMYYAGADNVVSIVPVAHVQWTVADKTLPSGGIEPLANWTGALAQGHTLPVINITTTAGLVPDYQDPNLGNATTVTYASAGKRNVCYLLDEEDIIFTEILP
jgi:hypothetical protein